MARKSLTEKSLTAVDIQILMTLATGPLHGYGIKLDVAQRTHGRVNLGSGTLYEAIQRLEQRAFIAVSRPPEGQLADARRRYYKLESAGEQALRSELERMATVVRQGQMLHLLPRREEV